MQESFINACSLWKEQTKRKPTFIVEDIHALKDNFDALPSYFVDVFNNDLLNVVYVVSDFSAVAKIKSGMNYIIFFAFCFNVQLLP